MIVTPLPFLLFLPLLCRQPRRFLPVQPFKHHRFDPLQVRGLGVRVSSIGSSWRRAGRDEHQRSHPVVSHRVGAHRAISPGIATTPVPLQRVQVARDRPIPAAALGAVDAEFDGILDAIDTLWVCLPEVDALGDR